MHFIQNIFYFIRKLISENKIDLSALWQRLSHYYAFWKKHVESGEHSSEPRHLNSQAYLHNIQYTAHSAFSKFSDYVRHCTTILVGFFVRIPTGAWMFLLLPVSQPYTTTKWGSQQYKRKPKHTETRHGYQQRGFKEIIFLLEMNEERRKW